MIGFYLGDITYYKQLYYEGKDSRVQMRSNLGVYSGEFKYIHELYPDMYTLYEVSVQQGIFIPIMVLGFVAQVPSWIGISANNIIALRTSAVFTGLNAILAVSLIFMFQSQVRILSLVCLSFSILSSVLAALISDKITQFKEEMRSSYSDSLSNYTEEYQEYREYRPRITRENRPSVTFK